MCSQTAATSTTNSTPSNAKSSSSQEKAPSKRKLADFDSETNCILNNNDVTVLDTSWAEAPEFVPSFHLFTPSPVSQSTCSSYSQATKAHMIYPYGANINILEHEAMDTFDQFATAAAHPTEYISVIPATVEKSDQICTLHMDNGCYSGDACPYLHGNQCPICSRNCLHPTDKDQRDKHEMVSFNRLSIFFSFAKSKQNETAY